MSENRQIAYRKEPRRDPVTGIMPCRWCGKPVPQGRKWYCSKACKDEYYIRRNYSPRDFVRKRDHGICLVCGLDCDELEKAIRELRPWEWSAGWGKLQRFNNSTFNEFCRSLGLPKTGHTWEADHIKPVSEGGGECGLDNYRTLCIWCHRKETAALHKRLAAKRRSEQPQDIPLFQGQHE